MFLLLFFAFFFRSLLIRSLNFVLFCLFLEMHDMLKILFFFAAALFIKSLVFAIYSSVQFGVWCGCYFAYMQTNEQRQTGENANKNTKTTEKCLLYIFAWGFLLLLAHFQCEIACDCILNELASWLISISYWDSRNDRPFDLIEYLRFWPVLNIQWEGNKKQIMLSLRLNRGKKISWKKKSLNMDSHLKWTRKIMKTEGEKQNLYASTQRCMRSISIPIQVRYTKIKTVEMPKPNTRW